MDRHDGFARSVFAWVPSRGISGIAVPGGVSMHLPAPAAPMGLPNTLVQRAHATPLRLTGSPAATKYARPATPATAWLSRPA